jgi:hypothetical protein
VLNHIESWEGDVMNRSRWIGVILTVVAGAFLTACAQAPVGLQSLELDAASSGEADLEFTGLVDSVGSNAWSVGGLVVGVAASTEISGQPGVGDLVRVQALAVDETTLVAREISLLDAPAAPQAKPPALAAPGQEIEFFGPVVTIASDAWLVGDQIVSILSTTEIKGTMTVGDPVKVHALVQADGSLTANEIEAASEDDLQGDDLDEDSNDDSGGAFDPTEEDLEIKGVVTAIEGDQWTVAGVTFVVPAGTPMDGSIQVGDTVEVHAVWSAEGVLTATGIHLEDAQGEDDDQNEDDGAEDDDDDDGDEQDDDGDDDNSGPGGGEEDNSGSGGGDHDSGGDD